MKTPLRLASLALSILAAGRATAATIRVPSEVSTIPVAIDAASPGDTVLVAPGTYRDVVVKSLELGFIYTLMGLLKDDIVVTSEAGPGATILDMSTSPLVGFTMYFYAEGLASLGTTIEGFTFLGAGMDVHGIMTVDGEASCLNVRSCRFLDLETGGAGSAISNVSADLNVTDCAFVRCHSEGGAAAINSIYANLAVDRCTIRDCESLGGAVSAHSNILERPVRCEIKNSHFVDNRFPEKGFAGGAIAGAAIMKSGNALTHFAVSGCTFVGNEAPQIAAIIAGGYGSKVIQECVFWNNRSTKGEGGAVAIVDPGNIAIIGNVFVGNSQVTDYAGSALSLGPDAGLSEINHNIFAWNSGGPALFVAPTATGSIEGCNLFWQNAGGDLFGQVPAASDLFLDPEFCDWESGNFTLRDGSPCLPSPSGPCGLLGPFDVGCGAVSIDAESWGQIKAKYLERN